LPLQTREKKRNAPPRHKSDDKQALFALASVSGPRSPGYFLVQFITLALVFFIVCLCQVEPRHENENRQKKKKKKSLTIGLSQRGVLIVSKVGAWIRKKRGSRRSGDPEARSGVGLPSLNSGVERHFLREKKKKGAIPAQLVKN
jgi:hypothetical protein